MRLAQNVSTDALSLYEEVAARIGRLIEKGTYRPGDRVPSVRGLSRQMHVSINTVLQAYAHLESTGAIEARPQSGYYVRSRMLEPEPRLTSLPLRKEMTARRVLLGDVPLEILSSLSNPALVPLGRGVPNPELLPVDKLNRMLGVQARRSGVQSVCYPTSKGNKRLRVQIAQRALGAGCAVSPEEMVITSGCVEAVTLALQAICRPGDTVAIGSPVYATFLNSIQWMGLKVLEIPSGARDGLNLEVLEYAIRQSSVRACIGLLTFNNPLGSLVPEERKRELVELLAKHEIPLIEDDVYGDLAYGTSRPPAAKAFDRNGLVLLCSSFSKTLAPGYRVGWIIPGRFQPEVERLKSLFNVATAAPTQLAIAGFLADGAYDRHLRTVRRIYSRQVARVREAVGRHFPLGTRVTRPEGGFILWVEMPEAIDSFRLYQKALQKGISVAPGTIFTIGDKYRNCIRLSAACWSDRIERAVETLGGLARKMV